MISMLTELFCLDSKDKISRRKCLIGVLVWETLLLATFLLCTNSASNLTRKAPATRGPITSVNHWGVFNLPSWFHFRPTKNDRNTQTWNESEIVFDCTYRNLRGNKATLRDLIAATSPITLPKLDPNPIFWLVWHCHSKNNKETLLAPKSYVCHL